MSQPSANWQTVPVFGTYRKIDGSPHTGSLEFTFSVRVTANTDDVIFPAGSVRTIGLDADGHATLPVPAVDDPDNTPAGWSIKVTERLDAGGGLTYFIQPSLSMLPDGLNLRTLVLDAGNSTPAPAQVKGVAGGLAGIDADGDVVDAAGNKLATVAELGTGGGASDAVDVAFTPTGTIAATNVQAAVAEVATDAASALSGETTARTTADNLRQLLSEKGQVNGYAALDGTGKLPSGQLPSLRIAKVSTVVSQAAMLALAPDDDMQLALRSDNAGTSNPTVFALNGGADPTVLGNWQAFPVGQSLTGAELLVHKDAALGYPSLDAGGKVPVAELPVGTSATTVAAGNDSRLASSGAFAGIYFSANYR